MPRLATLREKHEIIEKDVNVLTYWLLPVYAGWTLWLAGCSICCRSNRYERGDNVDIPPKFIIFRRVFPLCAKAFNFCRRFRSHLSSGSLSLSLSVYWLVWLSFAATLWWICHSCLVLLLLPMLLLPIASSRRAFPLRLLPCALSVFKICHDHYHNWSCFVMAPPLCLPSFHPIVSRSPSPTSSAATVLVFCDDFLRFIWVTNCSKCLPASATWTAIWTWTWTWRVLLSVISFWFAPHKTLCTRQERIVNALPLPPTLVLSFSLCKYCHWILI